MCEIVKKMGFTMFGSLHASEVIPQTIAYSIVEFECTTEGVEPPETASLGGRSRAAASICLASVGSSAPRVGRCVGGNTTWVHVRAGVER